MIAASQERLERNRVTSIADNQSARGGWQALSAPDRESFLSAITRHRRASWRVTAACAAAGFALAVVVAILMAPLLYSLLALAFDTVNLATPAPDLMRSMGHLLEPLFAPRKASAIALVRVGGLAALPGLVLMSAAALALRHIWMTSPLFNAGDLSGRPPDRRVLAEERLANVVEEMSLAAGIPVPRIVVLPGGLNAAACGRDQTHVTLIVGDALPAGLDREEIEGLIAHLVASIADGDMTIGLRVTTTLALFGLVARVGVSFGDREQFWQTARLWRVFVTPTSADTAALIGALADPFKDRPAEPTARPTDSRTGLTWREWLLMPLMGPIVITGFLSGLVTAMMLEPLVSLAWRQRKYMADATAVRLTRDPDALASALAAIADRPQRLQPWAAHLAVAAGSRGEDGPFGASMVPIFPSTGKRVAALGRMGAHVPLEPKRHVPWPAALVLALLASVLATLMGVVVYLLVVVSAALSGLFTVVPAGLLHVLLRAIGR
jgi:Zn-dependent protease with chaperone function